MTTDEWQDWWPNFLQEKKLLGTIRDLDEADRLNGQDALTEKICFTVYHHYDEIKEELEKIKIDLMDTLGGLAQVHLQSGRVKEKHSLIEKVIRKRYEYIGSKTSAYANLRGDNYTEIITDLIGVKLIVNYRGKWLDIHREIIKQFPLKDLAAYEAVDHLPHVQGETFLAERPKAYYAKGDQVQQYEREGLLVKEHRQGYRSIHYVISYQMHYVELQVRTIYDEAWSDCDHNYVYKHDAKPNNRALHKLSGILCQLTNVANDIGDNMHDIYEEERFSETDGSAWKATKADIKFFTDAVDRLKKAQEELEAFSGQLTEDDEAAK